MTIAVRKQLLGVAATVFIVLLAACTTLQQSDSRTSHFGGSTVGLGDLTTQLHEDMLLRQKMDRFAALASDKYIVMIPGGIMETKQENIEGAKNFNVQSVKFSNVSVRLHGISAVVTGRFVAAPSSIKVTSVKIRVSSFTSGASVPYFGC